MLLTWILGGVSVGAITIAMYYANKIRDYKASLQSALQSEQSVIKILNQRESELNAIINSEDWRLAYRVYKCNANGNIIGEVVVGMKHEDYNFMFRIKSFEYDINDPSDREFAIREAEELIETIKKF